MIRDWRQHWNDEFAFGIVQLANFMHSDTIPVDSDWPELREAQFMTAAADSAAGLAVTIDIGDSADIHPKNKQDVGKRLSFWALATVYGKKLEHSGPVFSLMAVDSGKAVLEFTHADSLVIKGANPSGFTIAGADRKFVWAEAAVTGKNRVVVRSDKVAKPVAVRYGWANNPQCNLYNQAGLPMVPFRTDTWPGVTANTR